MFVLYCVAAFLEGYKLACLLVYEAKQDNEHKILLYYSLPLAFSNNLDP